MIHSAEPRVGLDRPLSVVREEAVDFLRQLRRDEVIESDAELQDRTIEVLEEIEAGSNVTTTKSKVTTTKEERVGGRWCQTRVELEHGIRLAWKHSRRCIMRSQYEDLRCVGTPIGIRNDS